MNQENGIFFVFVFCGGQFVPHLKDSEHGDRKGVKVGSWGAEVEVEGAPEQLHPEQGEDEDEEEEEEEEGDDGLHGSKQRDNKVSQGGPVSSGRGG